MLRPHLLIAACMLVGSKYFKILFLLYITIGVPRGGGARKRQLPSPPPGLVTSLLSCFVCKSKKSTFCYIYIHRYLEYNKQLVKIVRFARSINWPAALKAKMLLSEPQSVTALVHASTTKLLNLIKSLHVLRRLDQSEYSNL